MVAWVVEEKRGVDVGGEDHFKGEVGQRKGGPEGRRGWGWVGGLRKIESGRGRAGSSGGSRRWRRGGE